MIEAAVRISQLGNTAVPVFEVKCHLHGYEGREVARVVGQEKRAMVALAARNLVQLSSYQVTIVIRTIEVLIISFQQKHEFREMERMVHTSRGRYIPPKGIGARASPKASFNTVSAITMIGRLSWGGWKKSK